jgi:hypothetical protein
MISTNATGPTNDTVGMWIITSQPSNFTELALRILRENNIKAMFQIDPYRTIIGEKQGYPSMSEKHKLLHKIIAAGHEIGYYTPLELTGGLMKYFGRVQADLTAYLAAPESSPPFPLNELGNHRSPVPNRPLYLTTAVHLTDEAQQMLKRMSHRVIYPSLVEPVNTLPEGQRPEVIAAFKARIKDRILHNVGVKGWIIEGIEMRQPRHEVYFRTMVEAIKESGIRTISTEECLGDAIRVQDFSKYNVIEDPLSFQDPWVASDPREIKEMDFLGIASTATRIHIELAKLAFAIVIMAILSNR